MITSRYTNKNLQVIVSQTILAAKPQFKKSLIVTADAKGIVHLKGKAQNPRDCKVAVELARGVLGVTDVFCNLAVEV